MSGLSASARAAAFAATLGGDPLAQPSAPLGTMWLAVLLSDAGDSGDATTLPEAAYGGYERTALPFHLGWVLDASSSFYSNSVAIDLATVTAAPAQTCGFWAVCDAQEGGQWWWSGSMNPVVFSTADPDPVVPAGYLMLYLAPGS